MLTKFPNGVSSFGVPVISSSAAVMAKENEFGTTYFVDPTNGSDGNKGTDKNNALRTFTQAMVVVKSYDTIRLASGGYTGNFTTPLNAVAPFVSVIGNEGTYFAASSSSSPIVEVRARGWRWSGIEFDNPTGAAGLRMTKEAGLLTRGADFFIVENCLFFGGKAGIEFNGGGTYWKIRNNHFSLISTSGAGAVWVGSSSYQVPALGLIEGNRFDNNVNHIDGNNDRGFSDTVISGNNFMRDSNGTDTTVMIDIAGSGGGNSVIGNYFDIAKAEFNTGGTQRIFSNSTDYGAGNQFEDGAQAATMRA